MWCVMCMPVRYHYAILPPVKVYETNNLQRESRSLPREGRDPLFSGMWGSVWGFSTETTGSLRNPETWRTPSYQETKNHIIY